MFFVFFYKKKQKKTFVFILLIIAFLKKKSQIFRKKTVFFRNFPAGNFSGIFGDFRGNFLLSRSENGATFWQFCPKIVKKRSKIAKKNIFFSIHALQLDHKKIT
tara:strand:- start:192 stop:503 length:312 start_codon:yes stop_codon:yes gene_type:complete